MSIFQYYKKLSKKRRKTLFFQYYTIKGIKVYFSSLKSCDHTKKILKKKNLGIFCVIQYIVTMNDKKIPKIPKKYNCELCDYNTSNKKDYEKHLSTLKHQKRQNDDKIEENDDKKSPKIPTLICECGKLYKYRQGLSTHKKKCSFHINKEKLNNKNDENDISYKEMFLTMVSANKELRSMVINQQQQMSEIIPKLGATTNNTNNTINNNQRVNINVFLNEKCKDAINMKEFINQIQLTLDNLDFSKHKGLEAGLTNIFIENMNKLSLYERPIHCTDTKRDTLYIRENDSWEKDKDKSRIKHALKNLNKNHFKLIQQWIEKNPDFMDHEDKQAYFARILKTCGAELDDEKIIKKICTSNYIKNQLKDLDENLIE